MFLQDIIIYICDIVNEYRFSQTITCVCHNFNNAMMHYWKKKIIITDHPCYSYDTFITVNAFYKCATIAIGTVIDDNSKFLPLIMNVIQKSRKIILSKTRFSSTIYNLILNQTDKIIELYSPGVIYNSDIHLIYWSGFNFTNFNNITVLNDHNILDTNCINFIFTNMKALKRLTFKTEITIDLCDIKIPTLEYLDIGCRLIKATKSDNKNIFNSMKKMTINYACIIDDSIAFFLSMYPAITFYRKIYNLVRIQEFNEREHNSALRYFETFFYPK